METDPVSKALVRPHLRRFVIWTVLVLMLVSSLAVMPEEVEAQGPGMKDITFYFQNVTTGKVVGSITTLRIMNTTHGTSLNESVRSAKATQNDFYLYPVLADDTTVAGNVTVHIWARRIATSGDNRGATFLFRMYDVDGSGTEVATIASGSYSENNMMTSWREYRIAATNVANYTVAAGHTIRVYVEVDGSSSNDYQMAWGDTTRKSRAVIEMSDYVMVNDVDTLDHQRVSKVVFSQLTANKTIIFLANITDPYGGYDVKWVNATLVAPNGTTVLDRASMSKTKGYFNTYYNEYERTWNYSGHPTGQYNLTVSVVDWTGYYYRYPTNPGDTTFGGHLESMTTSFWIGGRPHNVTVNVTDDLDRALPGALVRMVDSSGVTNSTGSVVLMRANGTYDLEVYWQDVRVYMASHPVSNDTWIDVKAAVYSPKIVILDDVGDPVFDAVVFTTHPNGTVLDTSWRTDVTGSIQWDTMAGGDYRVSVLWMGVEVYNASVSIGGQGPFQLTVTVYQLDVQVVDSAGDGLELAQVIITNTSNGLVADSKVTDFTGVALSKVPIGSYDFKVYWRNELVFDDLNDHLVDYSGTLVLRARIYTVNLTVLDASDVPVAEARVVVGFAVSGQVQDFGTTDDQGVLSTRLPVGYYNLWVYWKDVLVNHTSNFHFVGAGDHTIRASVFWVDVHVQDTENVSVASALVSLRHADGLDLGTVSSDEGGNASYRLPIGDYRIVVSWKETVVYDQTRYIDSEDPLVLTVAIHYLRLHVVDSRNVPVENALVATSNDTTSAIVGSSVTDANGNITHRVPRGDYRLQIVWQEAVVYEAMRTVDHNDPATLVVNVFYVDIHVQDTLGTALEGAMITFSNITTGRSMGSRGTSEDGNVSYRVPIGDYHMDVIWQEAIVHGSDERVERDRDLVITALVYYAFIQVVDTTGVPIEGSSVTLTHPMTGRIMGSLVTGEDGNVTFRLPMDNYSIRIVWEETVVFDRVMPVDSNEPMVLVASVFYAELHVTDSTGIPLESALVTFTNTTSGRQMDEHTTDETGIVTFRLPSGNYSVEIVWRETVVWHVERLLVSNEPWTVLANVFYAELHVTDSTGVPLESAQVTFTNASSGRRMDEHTTGETGIVTFRLPMGGYRVRVVWRESVVWGVVRYLDDNDPWDVRAHVYYASLTITDSAGASLESALVTFTNTSSERLMGERTTAVEGVVTFRLPMGPYAVVVTWQETVVWYAERYLDSNEPWDVTANVFYAGFHVLDSRELPLEAALVSLTNDSSGRPMGDRTTGTDGLVVYRIPMGTYSVQVLWIDTVVFHQDIRVDSNEPRDLVVDVYYPTFHVADSQDVAVHSALVTMTRTANARIMGSQLTDVNGNTTFRVPMGEYDMTIVWLDTLVHRALYDVSSNEVHDVDAWVYYVDTTARDSRENGLEFPQIAMFNSTTDRTMASHTADVDGSTRFRLPVGEYRVEVQWQHALVLSETRMLDGDATWTLEAWVYYVVFHVTDGAGIDLAGASVSLENETASVAMGPVVTDAGGNAEFRLPLGDVTLQVTWRSVLVYEDDLVVVDGDATEELAAQVHYLTVLVIDSKGVKLKDAKVDVDRDGEVVASTKTDGNGEAFFRLPQGHYFANMSFSTTYYLTPIDVERSEEFVLDSDHTTRFDLTKEEYPVPFYMTNLFWVLLVIILLVLGLVLLVYRMRKTPSGEEAPIEYEEEDLADLLEDLADEEVDESADPTAVTVATGEEATGREEHSRDHLPEGTGDGPEEYTGDDLEEVSAEDEHGGASDGPEAASDLGEPGKEG